MSETIVLYGFGDNDRSGKVRWLARELGLAIEERPVAFGAQREGPYLALNPYGHIPTVVFRGETLIESTAACHLIAEAHDAPKLWIGPGEPGRRDYLTWLAIFGETLESRLVETALGKAGILPPAFAELHGERLAFKLGVAAARLPAEGYLAGGRFTLADIVAGYSLRLAVRAGLIAREATEPYLGRLVARPAAAEARFFGALGG
ncbi:MAG: glutathione S-transferase family protein [Myxococcales bacterium]|nr:glutathione S-transferase family protein [Myxococcales bacterium]MCB9735735.1 glutathione S-transferase family protein [Deltaproteobacteria bacterium]